MVVFLVFRGSTRTGSRRPRILLYMTRCLSTWRLTDGQGRALSTHHSKAYDRYAKRTFARALAATRKRRAHVLAIAPTNASGTECQNEQQLECQNDAPEEQNGIA
jgi:hypothetical protein